MLLLFCFVFMAASSYSLDTLKQGESLNYSQQLVSANKRFTLGFFRLVPENIYLAICFTNSTMGAGVNYPVWIANRNIPFQNESAVLSLHLDRTTSKLIIRSNTSDSIELYSGQAEGNITATLSNTGNFVLNGSAGAVLWQSFDYPSHTLLPGMKLGLNHRTGKNWTVRSWLAIDRPSDGAFSLEWDPAGPRLVVKRRGVVYWASGNSKDKPFEFIQTDGNVNYYFQYASNDDEEYFSYEVNHTSMYYIRNYRSAWTMRYDGQVTDPTYFVALIRVDLCYGYNTWTEDSLGGCQLWEQPKCRHSYQTFDLRSGGFHKPEGDFVNGGFFFVNLSLSISDCREICWKDCDCVGYRDGDSGNGCDFWRGTDLQFQQDFAGATVTQYVLISNPPKRKGNKWIWGVVAAATASSLCLLIGVLCYQRRKKIQEKKMKLHQLMTLDGYTDTFELANDGGNDKDVKEFSHACISVATNGFASKNKLGEGGFGPVYQGKLPEGQKVAVKRLSTTSGQGLLEFKTELVVIAKLQHRNLVRLFGYCIEGDEKMLVYEYMPNKSLDFFLFDETRKVHLPWDSRFNITKGIAQGLLYLHEYSRLNIVHRDLKASNILLDENMNPKISDFGTARIFKKNSSESNTIRIAGTRGYMAPEYVFEGTFSIKSDVFSFGVLVLEIVSGRRNNSFYDVEGTLNLVSYAWDLWKRDSAIELMDPGLVGSCTVPNQLVRCIHIGHLCVQHTAKDRPTMSDVMSMLSNDNSVLPPPKTPAFVTGSSLTEDDQRVRKPSHLSVNGLSISSIDAR